VRLAALSLLALVLVLPASAAQRPDAGGVLVASRSFDTLRLGASAAAIEARWGRRHGRCRDCRRTTWYFNRPFRPQGVGVEFRTGRAVAFITLWQPPGWRTSKGLRLGDPVPRITELYGPLPRLECGTYYALTLETARTLTAFYVVDEKLWGFGLMRPDVPACR
jgi:hypothetical protein